MTHARSSLVVMVLLLQLANGSPAVAQEETNKPNSDKFFFFDRPNAQGPNTDNWLPKQNWQPSEKWEPNVVLSPEVSNDLDGFVTRWGQFLKSEGEHVQRLGENIFKGLGNVLISFFRSAQDATETFVNDISNRANSGSNM